MRKSEKLTDEQVNFLSNILISNYVGMKCHFCGHVYISMEDLDKHSVVKDYDHNGEFSITCKECFTNNIEQTEQLGDKNELA